MDSDEENTWARLGHMTINGNVKKPLQEVQNHQSAVHGRTPLKDGSRSGSESDQNQDNQIMFNKLVTRAKKMAAEGDVAKALELNKRALKIHYTEKLAKRIKKMEVKLSADTTTQSSLDHDQGPLSQSDLRLTMIAYLAEYGSDEDDSMEHVGQGFYLYNALYNKLFAHQKEGVLWFWNLNRKKKGGILGDDMGLGKTIQVIAFLSGMFDMAKVNSVLIVMPVSLISNWEKEFNKWAPGISVKAYHGTSKKEKERALAKIHYRGGVMLTSYGLVVTSWQQISQKDGSEFVWDYVILDEGHKIKNPTKTTKGVHAIPAKNRIILTGTPIQNNLKELWALFDFVHQGQLLGTARTFKMEYDTPITRSRERDATAGERHLGQEMAESLRRIIEPYFLRRTKAEVTDKTKKADSLDEAKDHTKMPSLGRKNDFVIWLFLTKTQLKIYEDFLALDSVKELLMTTKSPLVALNVLKKVCDHPRLLSTRACTQLGLDGEDALNESDDSPSGLQCAATRIDQIEDNVLIGESGKLVVLVELLANLKDNGHRCLIFSQSRKILDIIQKIITNRGHKVMRLDGTVTQIAERDQRIKKFQTDDSYSVFLLTTQVGGVGLTLTAADRVVIFDPSWNPATDAQAVDRVFRIGQNKNVVIYRLITCGSVEEKIYRRQVFKDSITRQTTGNSKNPYRYFTKGELRELFTLDDHRTSKTQRQLQEMHGVDRRSDPKLDSHIAFLHSLEMFGVSDHDLMFSQEHANDIDSDVEQEVRKEAHSVDYIQHRVQKAQELLEMESSLSSTLQERFGKYPRNCDVEARQSRAPPSFFQPKTYDQKANKPKGSSDYESDVPLPSAIDLTEESDNEDNQEIEEIEDSPIKVKVDRSIVIDDDDKDNSLIEITDTPADKKNHSLSKVKVERSPERMDVKVERSSLEVKSLDSPTERKIKRDPDMYDADVSMTESDVQSPVGESKKNDTSHTSEKTEYDSCEEFDPENTGPLSNHTNDNKAQTVKDSVTEDDIDQVIDRIDHNMSIQPDSEDEKLNNSGMNVSRLNATCERLEDYLAESDQEELLEDLEEEPSPETGKFVSVIASSEAQYLKTQKRKLQTPERKRPLIIQEEMLISPEPASPLIEMKAKKQRRLSKAASPAQFLSRTLMSCASDTPDLDSRSSTSSSSSERLQATHVDDSPSNKRTADTSLNESDSALPSIKALTSLKSICVADSAENTPVFANDQNSKMNTSLPQEAVVMDSDEETPVKTNRRRSVCKRKVVIESSDEEDFNSRPSIREQDEDQSPERDDEDSRSVGDGSEADENEVDESLISEDEEKKAGSADSCDEEKSGEEEEYEENSDDQDFIDDSTEESEEDSEEESDYTHSEEEEDDGLNDLSPELKSQFEEFVQRGRSLYLSGEIAEALANILQALEIHSDPQLQELALKMHEEMDS